MKNILILLLAFISTNLLALEIDEKLTLRILSVSKSKKTILINRGIEDGIVVGDHAKLFLTTGVVGRAVVVKASPSRSIWSVYRIVDGSQIVEQKVMKLKVSSPLKLTEDPTRVLNEEQVVGVTRDRINVNKKDIDLSQEEMDDLSVLEERSEADLNQTASVDMNDEIEVMAESGSFSQRDWEVHALANFSGLSGTTEFGASSTETNASSSAAEFTLAIEKYWYMPNSFFNDVSINLFFNSRSVSSGLENSSSISFTEFGGGIDYYFYNNPHRHNKLLGHIGTGFGVGSASGDSTTFNSTSGSESTTSFSGSSSIFYLGVGGKYFLRNGFGAMAFLDYATVGAEFEQDDGSTVSMNLSGPRFRVGLGFRW